MQDEMPVARAGITIDVAVGSATETVQATVNCSHTQLLRHVGTMTYRKESPDGALREALWNVIAQQYELLALLPTDEDHSHQAGMLEVLRLIRLGIMEDRRRQEKDKAEGKLADASAEPERPTGPPSGQRPEWMDGEGVAKPAPFVAPDFNRSVRDRV